MNTNSENTGKPTLVFRLLTMAAIAIIAVAYFTPIWWVSLKAPNYPEDKFPDGVRIHFHFNGVFNGCAATGAKTNDIYEDEVLDCVHEMNTINHFIGMSPISEGAKVEIKLAPYLFVILGVVLAASMFYSGPLWWILPVAGIGLPLWFLADFSYWLWWFGHNLHPWGAFTVKPFMPTVFGVGKVAQFGTYAYPHYGFGLIVVSSILLALAALLHRKVIRSGK